MTGAEISALDDLADGCGYVRARYRRDSPYETLAGMGLVERANVIGPWTAVEYRLTPDGRRVAESHEDERPAAIHEDERTGGMRPFTVTPLLRHAAEQAKLEGFAIVEARSLGWVAAMRARAKEVARLRGSVTVDSLRAYAEELAIHGIHPSHVNAWGAIFRVPEFEFTGQYVASSVVSNHARAVRVWRIRG